MESFYGREERGGEEKHLWIKERAEDFLKLGHRDKEKEL